MLNNFIGGGQVFLHKVRMFWQVFTRTIHMALLLGVIVSGIIYSKELQTLDWQAVYSYRKAVLADEFDKAVNELRRSIGKRPSYVTFINAKSKSGRSVTNIDPRKIRYSYSFKRLNNIAIELLTKIAICSGIITFLVFFSIFLVWSRFGKALKALHSSKTNSKATGCLVAAQEIAHNLQTLLPFHIPRTMCIPCFFTISTSEVGVVESWGKFSRLVQPGLGFVLCPMEQLVGRLSFRVQQLDVREETKTLDNVFLTAVVSVQYQVLRESVFEAFYSLTNPAQQIT